MDERQKYRLTNWSDCLVWSLNFEPSCWLSSNDIVHQKLLQQEPKKTPPLSSSQYRWVTSNIELYRSSARLIYQGALFLISKCFKIERLTLNSLQMLLKQKAFWWLSPAQSPGPKYVRKHPEWFVLMISQIGFYRFLTFLSRRSVLVHLLNPALAARISCNETHHSTHFLERTAH